ncbi:GAF domain-containing protein [Glaciecola sp. KUL10]|uniref:GAF domain-containing protein n=1 Tax=Glaciecola sp. (strain KUL10) TaxID=2161813 RepID=UPI000D785AAE|nr:GAF domain-containing protein [Glaciecola sp. KUL10]GBL02844.1 GAF domain-containing protein [Glaciecola sp. KUL10]
MLDNSVLEQEPRDKEVSSAYSLIVKQVGALIEDEHDLIANLANVSAVLFNNLDDVNWAGFYLFKEGELVLGPFQGQAACIRIPMNKGVCGTAAFKKEAVLVDNVHEFSGHIACDAASNSEIVIPIIVEQKLIGVLDIDSPRYSRFNLDDLNALSRIVKLIEENITQGKPLL